MERTNEVVMGLCYRQLTELDVSQEVLNSFDCGHPDFNDFIREDAINMASNGEGVTYLLVDDAEAEQKNVTSFFAFATIKTTALYYENGLKLYKRKNFVDATEYMIPFEKDDEFGKCLAMYLPISENIYSIFGIE